MANSVLKVFQDEYDRNARLKPSLLVILPIGGVLTLFGFTFSAILGALAGPLLMDRSVDCSDHNLLKRW